MKTILIFLFLITSSAFADNSINNYSCVGQKFDVNGLDAGHGETFVVLLKDGTVQLIDKESNEVVELLLLGSESSGIMVIYRSASENNGVGLVIKQADIEDTFLGARVFISIFNISGGSAGKLHTLKCKIISASQR